MNISTLFIRVVPADRDRGYMLVVGHDSRITQTNCSKLTTLSILTRDSLNAAIERMRAEFNANDIRDVTPDGLKRKLQKEFGEPVTPKGK